MVYTIAPSPEDAKTVWAGTDTGRIWLTRDSGKTWNDVTGRDLQPWSKISMIEASRTYDGTAYAAVDRHRLDDYAPYIYVTRDYGQSWRKISTGIAAPAFVRSVREDPIRRHLLYAGTEAGVYVSFNDGENWSPLQLNLPVAPVHDLVVHDDDLVIATHGRSFWILDDVTPLRQARIAMNKLHAYLYEPQIAIRVRSDVARDTPLPADEPAGQNPPAGAILDYYLAKPAKEITLEIFDSSGRLVRRFSSTDKPFEADRNVAFTTSWFVPPTRLETTAGEHRLVWDLRYPDPPSLHKNYDISAVYGVGVNSPPRGPLVLPGEYQVQLTIADVEPSAMGTMSVRRPSQKLTVKLDPRLKVSAADLQKQFELEMEISAAMQQAYAALEQRGQLASAKQAQTPGEVNPLARTLNNLASLLEVVDAADAAPTQQAQEAWQELRGKLEQQIQQK